MKSELQTSECQRASLPDNGDILRSYVGEKYLGYASVQMLRVSSFQEGCRVFKTPLNHFKYEHVCGEAAAALDFCAGRVSNLS